MVYNIRVRDEEVQEITIMKKKQNESQRECPTGCRFCEKAALLDGGEQVLCKFKGIVPEDGSCRNFTYDPLTRIPRTPLKPPKLSPEDLVL